MRGYWYLQRSKVINLASLGGRGRHPIPRGGERGEGGGEASRVRAVYVLHFCS